MFRSGSQEILGHGEMSSLFSPPFVDIYAPLSRGTKREGESNRIAMRLDADDLVGLTFSLFPFPRPFSSSSYRRPPLSVRSDES